MAKEEVVQEEIVVETEEGEPEEAPNVLSEKAAEIFLKRKVDVLLRKYHIWRRGYQLYVDHDRKNLVIAKNGSIEQEVHIEDMQGVREEQKTVFVQDRYRREIALRFVDESEIKNVLPALQALVTAALDQTYLNSRSAEAKRMFRDADKNSNGSLSITEVVNLLNNLSINMRHEQIVTLFHRSDVSQTDSVSEEEFLNIFREIMRRKSMLTSVFYTYTSDVRLMSCAELEQFLVAEQGNDAQSAATLAASILESLGKGGKLDVDGFLDHLLSPENSAVTPDKHKLHMDMTRPMADYYINSSHNTYLEGNQITGSVSVDSYVKTLQAGARCVEIDLWEDEDGQITITHGHTLTGEIRFCDVVAVFADPCISFAKSEYPLILSCEDHLTLRSRQAMVQIMEENKEFWSMLHKPYTVEDNANLSPEDLKGKILIKMKIKKETPSELARLIFMQGVKHKGNWDETMAKPALACVSHDEAKLEQLIDDGEGDKVVEYNRCHVTRVYPSGKRVKSSNFDPSLGWLVRSSGDTQYRRTN
eukprot:Plantae.Rhodophyta-Purpureofilum_apyrenoidigerum.ctg19407.p1 GENE.Plantae.Rhodophyta-Purpureofilum_apyrenoidigerum.ctg19407~~Plantae.Rhodophyta-Purpureofilum_apyrenoidigerum.ctg19407.p1  ORF type:complete len:532 (+),score=117.11 Plantae.Rhodophyta-Purpureofilum_apyrenoidigerum.ctg19407:95-1690(+)